MGLDLTLAAIAAGTSAARRGYATTSYDWPKRCRRFIHNCRVDLHSYENDTYIVEAWWYFEASVKRYEVWRASSEGPTRNIHQTMLHCCRLDCST